MERTLLTDPEGEEPNERAVIDMWPLLPYCTAGSFRANPGYENSPAGADLLINPAGPACARLSGELVR